MLRGCPLYGSECGKQVILPLEKLSQCVKKQRKRVVILCLMSQIPRQINKVDTHKTYLSLLLKMLRHYWYRSLSQGCLYALLRRLYAKRALSLDGSQVLICWSMRVLSRGNTPKSVMFRDITNCTTLVV